MIRKITYNKWLQNLTYAKASKKKIRNGNRNRNHQEKLQLRATSFQL